MSNRSERDKYIKQVEDIENRLSIPSGLLTAVLDLESDYWDPDVIYGRRKGASGEIGAGQFMSSTIAGLNKQWGTQLNPANPEDAIKASGRYLNQLYDKYGDWEKAIAAYNAGEPDVDAALKQGGSGIRAGSGGASISALGLTAGVGPGGVQLGGTPDWKDNLERIQKQKYNGKVNTVKNYLPKVKNQGQAGGIDYTSSGPANATPRDAYGNPRMPTYDEFIKSAGGDSVQAYRDYLDLLKTHKEAERSRLGDMASYLELLGMDISQKIAAGNLSMQQAAGEFNRQIGAFEKGIGAFDTLSQYSAPVNDNGYLYGFEPGGLSSQLGLPSYRPTTQQVNPFTMAMDVLNNTPKLTQGVPDTGGFTSQVNSFKAELDKLLNQPDPLRPDPYTSMFGSGAVGNRPGLLGGIG